MGDHAITNEKVFPSVNDVNGGTTNDGRAFTEENFINVSNNLTGINHVISGLTVPGSSGNLNINVAAGQAIISGRFIDVPGSTQVTCTDSTTNYLYLKFNLDGDGDVTDAEYEVNTSGTQPADSVYLASLVASGGAITSTTDMRPRTHLANKGVNRLIASDTSVQDVVSTVAQTTVFSAVIPAGALSTDRGLMLRLLGDHLNNNLAGSTFQLRIKLGSTILFDSGTQGTGSTSANRAQWSSELFLSNGNSASVQKARGTFILGTVEASFTGVAQAPGTGPLYGYNDTSTENTANDLTLTVTLQNSQNSASLSTRLAIAQLFLLDGFSY